MRDVKTKAFAGLFFLLAAVGMVLFFSAGTFDYWQAWVFLAVFFGSSFAITVYLMKNDPELLARRVAVGPMAEKETSQKIIQFVAATAFLLVIVVPPLDHRFGWSTMPPYVNLAGDTLIAAGFFIVFLVFKANTCASALIEVGADQKVVSTGPYALVRHPMYIGALILLFGVPPALGSIWGCCTIIPITLVIVWRLLDEERVLVRDLQGYLAYQKK
jgi:protein-S-isoprenylcysteine O-methyltransferase Ste14